MFEKPTINNDLNTKMTEHMLEYRKVCQDILYFAAEQMVNGGVDEKIAQDRCDKAMSMMLVSVQDTIEFMVQGMVKDIEQQG